MNTFFNPLWSMETPVLPSPAAMRVALHLVWSIVLGCGALLMLARFARPYRWGLSLLVMLWTLVPGPVSPAYWLGLAFQTPSLTSAAICLGWVLNRRRQAPGVGALQASRQMDVPKVLACTGIVLGWVLLLDTLALLPMSVYAWGFSSAALGALAVFAALLWTVWGTTGASRIASMLMLCVLTLFVFTRLPTGNLWDALIDPWLWGGLQVGWLVNAVRCWKAKRLLPPTTHA